MKPALNRKPIIFTLYFLAISLLRWTLDINLVWFWLGGVLGMLFTYVDRFIHVYFTKPHEQLSETIKHLVSSNRIKETFRTLKNRGSEQRYLAARSVFFMGAFIPAAFYVITSTGSAIATGLVMGIGLNLVIDSLMGIKDLGQLKWWLFWPIKRDFSDREAKLVVWIFTSLFFLLSLLLV